MKESIEQLTLFDDNKATSEMQVLTASALPESAIEEWHQFYAAISNYATRLKPNAE